MNNANNAVLMPIESVLELSKENLNGPEYNAIAHINKKSASLQSNAKHYFIYLQVVLNIPQNIVILFSKISSMILSLSYFIKLQNNN